MICATTPASTSIGIALRLVAVAVAVTASSVLKLGTSSDQLAGQLTGLVFNNEGITRSTTRFAVAAVPCGYLEPENVTTPSHAWAQRGQSDIHICSTKKAVS